MIHLLGGYWIKLTRNWNTVVERLKTPTSRFDRDSVADEALTSIESFEQSDLDRTTVETSLQTILIYKSWKYRIYFVQSVWGFFYQKEFIKIKDLRLTICRFVTKS